MTQDDPAFSFWHEIIYNEDIDASEAWRMWGGEKAGGLDSKGPEYEKIMLRALAVKIAKVRARFGDDWMEVEK